MSFLSESEDESSLHNVSIAESEASTDLVEFSLGSKGIFEQEGEKWVTMQMYSDKCKEVDKLKDEIESTKSYYASENNLLQESNTEYFEENQKLKIELRDLTKETETLREDLNLAGQQLRKLDKTVYRTLEKVDNFEMLQKYETYAQVNWYFVGITDLAKNLTFRQNYTMNVPGVLAQGMITDLQHGIETMRRENKQINKDIFRPDPTQIKDSLEISALSFEKELYHLLEETKILFLGFPNYKLRRAQLVVGFCAAITRLRHVDALIKANQFELTAKQNFEESGELKITSKNAKAIDKKLNLGLSNEIEAVLKFIQS